MPGFGLGRFPRAVMDMRGSEQSDRSHWLTFWKVHAAFVSLPALVVGFVLHHTTVASSISSVSTSSCLGVQALEVGTLRAPLVSEAVVDGCRTHAIIASFHRLRIMDRGLDALLRVETRDWCKRFSTPVGCPCESVFTFPATPCSASGLNFQSTPD